MNRILAGWALLVLALTMPQWSALPGLARELGAGFHGISLPALLRAGASHGVTILLSAAAVLACAGAGSPVRRFGSPKSPGRLPLSLVAGWGALATAAFGLALTGLSTGPLLAIPAIASIALRIHAGCHARPVKTSAPGPDRGWLLAAGLPAVCLLPLLLAPVPYIDTYQYHLAAPERFLRFHRLSLEHANAGFRLPLTAELLNALPVALDRDELAAVMSGIPFIAALAYGGGWLARTSPAAAGLAVGAMLALRPVLWVAMTGKNDLAAAGLGILGLLAAARMHSLVSAAAFGLMAATKTSGLAFLGIGWLFHEGRRMMKAKRIRIPDPGWIVVAGLVPAGWLAKSWLIDGDPLWPALSARIGNPLWDAQREASFRNFLRVEGGVQAIPVLLWTALRDESPGWLVLLPGLALAKLPTPWKRVAMQGAVCLLACAFVIQYEFDRLMLPAVAALAFPAALGMLTIPRTGLVLALACVAGWAPAAGTLRLQYNRHAVGFLHGATTRADLRRLVHTTLDEARTDAGALPGLRTLILVNDNAAYRFPGRVATEEFHDRKPTWALTRDAGSIQRLLIRLRQMNATHLSVNVIREGLLTPGGAAYQFHPWSDRQLDLLHEFMRDHAEMVRIPRHCDHVNGGEYLWRISATPIRKTGPIHYLPGIQEVKSRMYQPWFDHRNYVECRDIALQLCDRYPDVLWFRAEAAFIAHLMEHQPACYHDYGMVLKDGFVGDHPLIFFAEAAAKTGHVQEAIDALNRSKLGYPDQVVEADRMLGIAWAMRSQELIRDKKPEQALEAANTGLQYSPDNASCHAAVAHALLACKRYDEAETIYRMILDRWPDDPQAQTVSRANLDYIVRVRAERARR